MGTFSEHLIFLVAILTLTCFVCTQQQSVVIIGAGPAGLAAATRLLENNLTDVIVLEAEDRIGGRVNSVEFGEAIVELGAEWCHGEKGNIVYEMVKDLDMLEDPGDGATIAFANGKLLEGNKSLAILQLFDEVYESEDENFVNSSFGEYFSAVFPDALKEYFKDDEETLKLALQGMDLYEHFILSLESAFSWDDISTISSYENAEGNFNLAWKGKGYKQIFDVMSKKTPKSGWPALPLDDKIRLNKTVSTIDYSGNKPVVTCKDGSNFTADYVIFTPSLGVLKHNHKDLFYPSLPEAKVSSINDLGFGAVIKIIQSYQHRWWPSDLAYGFAFNWIQKDYDEAVKLFPDGPIKDGKSWVSAIYNMLPAEHNPNVIYIWITGPFVPEIEKLSNSDIQKGIHYVFTKFLGQKYNVTEPDKMISYGWYCNPHFRGTYSYDTLRSRREQDSDSCRQILAKPEKNAEGKDVLFFAGEATNNIHYSTVHGAIESGHREAGRIIHTHSK